MIIHPSYNIGGIEAWQSLVHVCRRWRNLVFGSPRHLNLRLVCGPKKPARNTLDVWPALRLIVWGNMYWHVGFWGTENIIATLGQSNRVCEVSVNELAGWQLENVMGVMQVPYPELTDLELSSNVNTLSVIPDQVPTLPESLLGGSAPRLRHFKLSKIPCPGLPKLLSSAPHLVQLWLAEIPHSGYISPEAMVALLSGLMSLKSLSLRFQSPQSRPDSESPSGPLPNRSILPALRRFDFKGVTKYLEELVTRIDTPRLDKMDVTFFHKINFDIPRLAQFINRTPTLGTGDVAYVEFYDWSTSLSVAPSPLRRYRSFVIAISCRNPYRQLSSVTQVCNSSLYRLSMAENLYISHDYLDLVWKNNAIKNILWSQLLLPFTAVRNLYLYKEFALGIAAALQDLGECRITEMLPSLQNIFVKGLEPSGPFRETIEQFVDARQLSDHPVTISVWEEDSDME
jgi:hypothetical protein